MALTLKPLSEQTIVITGASSGIGLATARMAAERGARVVLVSRNPGALKAISEDITSTGGRADYVAADVSSREDMRRVVETVIDRHGGFDTWVNNAGIGLYSTLEEVSDQDHHRLFDVNYWGVVYGSTEALKHLRQRGGALINTGSISSDMPAPVLSAYTATKHAVKGFTDSLRLELMDDGAPVSVTLIKPSGIHTPFGIHARNYLPAMSQVPPPTYHPRLVAKAICHAAEHPTRDVLVGGAGLGMTLLPAVAPHLADRLYSGIFKHLALEEDEPNRGQSALYEPGPAGDELGDQDSHIRKTSLYTDMQLHPGATLALGIAAAALVLPLVMAGRSNGNGSSRSDARRQAH